MPSNSMGIIGVPQDSSTPPVRRNAIVVLYQLSYDPNQSVRRGR